MTMFVEAILTMCINLVKWGIPLIHHIYLAAKYKAKFMYCGVYIYTHAVDFCELRNSNIGFLQVLVEVLPTGQVCS